MNAYQVKIVGRNTRHAIGAEGATTITVYAWDRHDATTDAVTRHFEDVAARRGRTYAPGAPVVLGGVRCDDYKVVKVVKANRR